MVELPHLSELALGLPAGLLGLRQCLCCLRLCLLCLLQLLSQLRRLYRALLLLLQLGELQLGHGGGGCLLSQGLELGSQLCNFCVSLCQLRFDFFCLCLRRCRLLFCGLRLLYRRLPGLGGRLHSRQLGQLLAHVGTL